MKHDYIFVLEDDLEVIPNANGIIYKMLNHLDTNISAFSIYAHTSFSTVPFLSSRFSSQAWATSSQSWSSFDPFYIRNMLIANDTKKLIKKKLGDDFLSSLRAFQSKKLDSWAVPWNLYNLYRGKKMLYPPKSF